MPASNSKSSKASKTTKTSKDVKDGKDSKKRVNFALSAPHAQQVFVAGSFNDWSPTAKPLRLDKGGVWRTWVNLAPGKYEYLFVVDDEWCDDPACPERTHNPYGSHNCIVRV